MDERRSKAGRVLKRPNFNLSLETKAKKKRTNTPKPVNKTRMAHAAQEELANLRAQLQAQQQQMEQAKAEMKVARQQQLELGLMRDQLVALQRDRDEALAVLNNLRQNGQPPEQVQQQSQIPNNEVCNIISAMGFSQIEYKIPKFSDENENHPLEFLDKIEGFFRVKNISNDKKLAIIEMSLEGSARLWFNLQNQFESYEIFKIAFKARFFSVPVQIKLKNQWVMREYYEKFDGNFLNYYYSQLKKASYMTPAMSEYEKNYVIVKQFPWWVQEALASANFENTDSIAHTLSNLDAIRSEKQAARNNKYNNQTNNYSPNNHFLEPQTAQVREMCINTRSENNYRFRNSKRYNGYNRYNNNRSPIDKRSEYPSQPNVYNFNLPDTRIPSPNLQGNTHRQNNNNMGISSVAQPSTESANLNLPTTR